MTERLIPKWLVIFALIGLTAWLFLQGEDPIKVGIDLRGGKSIIYGINKSSLEQVDPDQRAAALEQTIETISKRIDSLGVRELTVRKIGDDKILIEAPKMTDRDLAAIKDQILALGHLEFLVGIDEWGASPLDIEGARPDEYVKYTFDKGSADEQRIAAYTTGKDALGRPYRDSERYTLLDVTTTPPRELPIIWVPKRTESEEVRAEIIKIFAGEPADHSKIVGSWLYRDPHFFGKGKEGFTGENIRDPKRSFDRDGRQVTFGVDRFRQDAFEEFTGKYVNKPMALMLNDEVWSAPTIEQPLRESVVIRRGGGGFSAEEQDMLVNCLTSGSLKLKPRQEKEEEIGPALGRLAIQRGTWATVISGILILLFMIWYYRTAGLVADFALLLNLFFILGVMCLFEATLSLPAIAGIILSMGMGVDANILVFERTREELQKGKQLLPALNGGYQGAFSAIFDGNVTAGITAALMIHFGTGPIRGFGTTLLAGLIIQLFTALFVTKACFGLLIKRGWLKKISFINVFEVGRVPWMAIARPWQMASLLLIVMTAVLFFWTGDKKYGLDFTGGTSLRLKLAAPATTADVQDAIDGIKDVSGNTKYEERDVILRTGAAGAEGDRSPEFDVKLRSIAAVEVEEVGNFVRGHMSRQFPATFDSVPSISTLRPGEWKVEFAFKEPVAVSETRRAVEQLVDENGNRPFSGATVDPVDTSEVEDPETLETTARATRFIIDVARQDIAAGSAVADLRKAFDGKLAAEAPFENVNYLGPNVVASLKESAIVSMIFALAGIILYLWFRFKEVKYGVAGVLALVHDVIVPCGIGILFHWTGILNVPITLQSVAAFLTIIGYSINDTIVIFDRVRENLGQIKGSYRDIMDISISQTFGRTILTTSAVFTVLLVLFVCNIGQDSPLEGMAFLLLLGTICGCYSTIFIACPFAVWVTERREKELATRARRGSASPGVAPSA